MPSLYVETAPPKKTIDWKLGMSVDEQNQVVKLDENNLAVVVFKWNGNHNMYQFPDKDAFENCDFSQATMLSSSSTTSSFTFRARSSGAYYFGCEVGSHCRYGQKLALQVTGGTFLHVRQIHYCNLWLSLVDYVDNHLQICVFCFMNEDVLCYLLSTRMTLISWR